MDDRRPLCWAVLTGTSCSRRDHPKELIESLKEEDAMISVVMDSWKRKRR